MRLVGSEEELCFQLANYMRLHHPGVLFHFDFGSGTKLTMGQAVKQKRLNQRAWPDLFIAGRSIHVDSYGKQTLKYGLFLELKREGTRLHKKDGSFASEHLAEQSEVLSQLRREGYTARFATGFDDAVKIIEQYVARRV